MTLLVSQIVLEDLSRAREGFVLASDLHLVYLVTPTNVDVEPDWELYYQRFMELSALDQVISIILTSSWQLALIFSLSHRDLLACVWRLDLRL